MEKKGKNSCIYCPLQPISCFRDHLSVTHYFPSIGQGLVTNDVISDSASVYSFHAVDMLVLWVLITGTDTVPKLLSIMSACFYFFYLMLVFLGILKHIHCITIDHKQTFIHNCKKYIKTEHIMLAPPFLSKLACFALLSTLNYYGFLAQLPGAFFCQSRRPTSIREPRILW